MLPVIKEITSSSYNLANTEYSYLPETQVVSTQGFSTEGDAKKKKFKSLHNKDVLVHLESRERMETVLHHCTNIDMFKNMETLLVWVVLTGYKIPLLNGPKVSTTSMAPHTDPQSIIKSPGIMVYPVLQMSVETYAPLVAEFFYQRFPERSVQILLNDPLHSASQEDWIRKSIEIFTHNKYGHSVSPSIFDRNPSVQLLVPPCHALPSAHVNNIRKDFLQVLNLTNPNHPMQCSVCRTTQVWQFAYKHCQCTQSFTSCFPCALKEWFTACRQGRIIPTHNVHIVLVTCEQCHREWSLFSLLHVQGVRSWFEDRARSTK